MSSTTEYQISEKNAKHIKLFTKLITLDIEPAYLHKAFSNLYINYTRLLIKSAINDTDNVFIDKSTDTELYYLSEIMKVLEEGVLNEY